LEECILRISTGKEISSCRDAEKKQLFRVVFLSDLSASAGVF